MADRRTSERLLTTPESLEYFSPNPGPEHAGSDETEEQTEPMRLSFLALLAEREPAVQTRLNLRRKLALEAERLARDDNRPTDPMTRTEKKPA